MRNRGCLMDLFCKGKSLKDIMKTYIAKRVIFLYNPIRGLTTSAVYSYSVIFKTAVFTAYFHSNDQIKKEVF